MGSQGEWHYSFVLKDLPKDLSDFFQQIDEYVNISNSDIDFGDLEDNAPSYPFFEKHKYQWYKALTGEFFKYTVQGDMMWDFEPSGYSFLMCVRETGKEARGINFEDDFLEMIKPYIVGGAFIHWGEYYSGSCMNSFQIIYPKLEDDK